VVDELLSVGVVDSLFGGLVGAIGNAAIKLAEPTKSCGNATAIFQLLFGEGSHTSVVENLEWWKLVSHRLWLSTTETDASLTRGSHRQSIRRDRLNLQVLRLAEGRVE
jgi:hypothetical protein